MEQQLYGTRRSGRIKLRWAGHVSRMEDSDTAKQAMEQQRYGTRRAGRPKLRWAGHVSRMEDSDPAKQAMEQQLYWTRRAGRPKLRSVNSVAQDARNMEINNWKTAAQDRERWRGLLAEARTRQGL
jgi:hypothetical protein